MKKALEKFSPYIQISTKTILDNGKAENNKNIVWTTDIKQELPIFLGKEDINSIKPTTVIHEFEEAVKEEKENPFMYIERDGKWQCTTWSQSHKQIIKFAKSCISVGVEPFQTVNILGCNSPEWFCSFLGGMYACVIPVGIYLTNNSDSCVYISQHSECGVLVVDSIEQYKKYESRLGELKRLKAIVIWGNIDSDIIKSLINQYVPVYSWIDFLTIGGKGNAIEIELSKRIEMQKPGNCCNVVYTSGTTGNPKAVLLSHDNMTYTTKAGQVSLMFSDRLPLRLRLVSYLPLSHIAGSIFDIMTSIIRRNIVYFARPDALQGSLLATLLYVKPQLFFAVPRVYEKFEERIRQGITEANFLKKKIAIFARKQGIKYVDSIQNGKGGTPLFYPIANILMFKKLKKTLGLDECEVFAYGAAPMKKKTFNFFKSLSIIIYNNYGLSESTGPQYSNFKSDINTVGIPLAGTEGKIIGKDSDGVGEICFRGRNRFMGYWKNEEATKESIDSFGYLHSGDQGYINKEGNLIITGRLKELLVTAGGENVAPVPIEDLFKEVCKICSFVMVIGDFKKYLSAFITIKADLTGNLLPEIKADLKEIGSEATNIIEAINCPMIKKYIEHCLNEVNKKSISRAQLIKKYKILTHDFSIETGELTPTMKLKRKFVTQKYAKEIDNMYSDPKF
jgi:long-chain-fatty-acid--CoA ligase ACSBG